jgi:hypothetical protein
MKVLASAALVGFMAFPALGQDCHQFDALDATLRADYSERSIILAVDSNGAAFLFYGNPETESWTIVLLAGQCAQVMAYGVGYEEVPAFPGEPS